MLKEKIKKLASYYVSVVKKYGIVLPVILVVASFALMLTLDLLNAFTALIHASKGGFVAFIIIAIAVFVVGAIFTVHKMDDAKLGIQDLGLTCIAAIGVLVLVMFCFTSTWNPLSITKILVVLAATVCCVSLSALRTKHVK